MGVNDGSQEQPGAPKVGAGPAQAVGTGNRVTRSQATHNLEAYIKRRLEEGPIRIADQLDRGTAIARLNSRIAVLITVAVGSMWCAYLFTLLALISFPSAIGTHNTIVIVAWIAQTFLQLVLLPVIIVGQNIQGEASDKRAVQTYNDAEKILHEALHIQDHLSVQDEQLQKQAERLGEIVAALERGYPGMSGGAAPATTT